VFLDDFSIVGGEAELAFGYMFIFFVFESVVNPFFDA